MSNNARLPDPSMLLSASLSEACRLLRSYHACLASVGWSNAGMAADFDDVVQRADAAMAAHEATQRGDRRKSSRLIEAARTVIHGWSEVPRNKRPDDINELEEAVTEQEAIWEWTLRGKRDG